MQAGRIQAGAALCALALSAAEASAAITFAPADYDNTANTVIAGPTPVNNQTTGKFRDIFWWRINNGQPLVGSPDFINRGNRLVLINNSAAPNPAADVQALNFTGPSIGGGQSYLSIFDTTPGDGAATKNVFDASQPGGIKVSADVLFVKHNVSGGVVALYNEGQDALALLAHNGAGNNPDNTRVSLVFQSPGQGDQIIQSINLPANTFFASEDDAVNNNSTSAHWYRVTMNLSVSGDTWTMNGTFHNHVNPADPSSALGAIIPNSTLNVMGSLLNPGNALDLTNPGEVGIVAVGNESISLPDNVGLSVTNFDVPEPTSIAAIGLVGASMLMRRRK